MHERPEWGQGQRRPPLEKSLLAFGCPTKGANSPRSSLFCKLASRTQNVTGPCPPDPLKIYRIRMNSGNNLGATPCKSVKYVILVRIFPRERRSQRFSQCTALWPNQNVFTDSHKRMYDKSGCLTYVGRLFFYQAMYCPNDRSDFRVLLVKLINYYYHLLRHKGSIKHPHIQRQIYIYRQACREKNKIIKLQQNHVLNLKSSGKMSL